MSRLTVWPIVLVLAPLLATAAGCNEEKKQLLMVQQQYNELQDRNRELQSSLATSQARTADLEGQLTAKDTQLLAAMRERDGLKSKLDAPEVDEPKAKPVPTGWTPTPGGAMIALSSDILFASGRATLSTAGAGRLSEIVTTIRSRYPGATVRVIGHTDSDPIVKSRKLWEDNLDLSANRAMAVTRELAKLGIPDKQIETVAMGSTQPVAPNDGTAGKGKNRRVEIAVVDVR